MRDIIFIGSGPATISALLRLIELNYKGNILVLEKGKKVENRTSKDILNGFGGAGTFSDCKLSSDPYTTGGKIPGIDEEDYYNFEDWIVKIYNKFLKNTSYNKSIEWDKTCDYNVNKCDLHWDRHKCLHIGTDRAKEMFIQIEHFIESQSNIQMMFENEVEDISFYNNRYVVKTNIDWYSSKNLVLATGQKGLITPKTIEKFNLPFTPNVFQLGIRVEDLMSSQYEEIIKANYDFKFSKSYDYNGVKIRVRTFCVNSGNAHIAKEVSKDGYTLFNGHAYKAQDPNNHTINYGIICECEGLKGFETKEKQIEFLKKVNSISCWKEDNLDENNNPKAKRELLRGFPQLVGIYPFEVIESLTDFISNLNKVVDLSHAHYYYPESKLSGVLPQVNYKTYETTQPNLYIIGDCLNTRGIVKSSYEGYLFASNFKEIEI